MKISEIFLSIQGEGQWLGMPSVFIRTSGCNLRCQWCDTPYASWNPDGTEMSIEAILDQVGRHPVQHVVITGGEPLIQAEVVELAAKLKIRHKYITLETAGTFWRNISVDLASISPKLANSTPYDRAGGTFAKAHESARIDIPTLAQFVRSTEIKNRQWKFVICSPEDINEVEGLLAQLPEFAPARENIFLMPEGIDADELDKKGAWLAELCKSRGYRYGARLHISLYGNRRGV